MACCTLLLPSFSACWLTHPTLSCLPGCRATTVLPAALSAADSRQTLRPCRCKRAAIGCSRYDSCPRLAAARCVKPFRASQYNCHTTRCTGHVMERDTRFTCFAYCTYMGKAGRGSICAKERVPTNDLYTQGYTMVCILFRDMPTLHTIRPGLQQCHNSAIPLKTPRS